AHAAAHQPFDPADGGALRRGRADNDCAAAAPALWPHEGAWRAGAGHHGAFRGGSRLLGLGRGRGRNACRVRVGSRHGARALRPVASTGSSGAGSGAGAHGLARGGRGIAALARDPRRRAGGDAAGRMRDRMAMPTSPAAIALEQVSKRYGTVAALQRLDLRVEAGEWLALMGPSGSGKTTLVNLIGCLDQPSEGAVRIDGTLTSSFSRRELTRFRAEKIGFIF